MIYHHQNQISDISFPQEREKNWSIKEALKEVPRQEHLRNKFS